MSFYHEDESMSGPTPVDPPELEGEPSEEYAQNVTYTVADIWDAYERGAKETRAAIKLGEFDGPSDPLIAKAADAYCKLVHPTAASVQREPAVTDDEIESALRSAREHVAGRVLGLAFDDYIRAAMSQIRRLKGVRSA